MAPDSKSKIKTGNGDAKGRKRQYLPHNVSLLVTSDFPSSDLHSIATSYVVELLCVLQRPVKKKGYPLRPGVQGFFITCDGGREHQASREAINVFDSVCQLL